MFLPDDPESNTRNVDSDKEEKVLVTPEDLMTEQGSCRDLLLSMTSELVVQSVLLVMVVMRRGGAPQVSKLLVEYQYFT